MNLNIHTNYVSPNFMAVKKHIVIALPAAVATAAAAATKPQGDTFTKSSNKSDVKSNTVTYTPEELAKKYQSNSKVKKLLEVYANDTDMQQNPHITNLIEYILNHHIRNKDCKLDQDCLIELLRENTKNDDKNYFESLKWLSYYNIHSDLIRKIMSDKKFYTKICSTESDLRFSGLLKADKNDAISILNYYKSNINSEYMFQNIHFELSHAFYSTLTQNPLGYIMDRNKHFSSIEKIITDTPELYLGKLRQNIDDILSAKYEEECNQKLEEFKANNSDYSYYTKIDRLRLRNRLITEIQAKKILQIARDIEDMLETETVAKNLKDIKDELESIVNELFEEWEYLEWLNKAHKMAKRPDFYHDWQLHDKIDTLIEQL